MGCFAWRQWKRGDNIARCNEVGEYIFICMCCAKGIGVLEGGTGSAVVTC